MVVDMSNLRPPETKTCHTSSQASVKIQLAARFRTNINELIDCDVMKRDWALIKSSIQKKNPTPLPVRNSTLSCRVYIFGY